MKEKKDEPRLFSALAPYGPIFHTPRRKYEEGGGMNDPCVLRVEKRIARALPSSRAATLLRARLARKTACVFAGG